MQITPARKRKQHLHDLAEARKLLVPAGYPAVSRDYRLGMPDGELELFPDPATIPTIQHATTDFQVMFFPTLGMPIDVTEMEEERWLGYLRARIEDLKTGR